MVSVRQRGGGGSTDNMAIRGGGLSLVVNLPPSLSSMALNLPSDEERHLDLNILSRQGVCPILCRGEEEG